MSYKLNDWDLTTDRYVTPKAGEAIGEHDYVTFDVPDLSTAPFTSIYRGSSNTDKGNSVEIVADLSDEDSGTYLTMFIDDGTNRQGIKIYNGYIKLLAGSEITIEVENSRVQPTEENPEINFHRYTITLNQNRFKVYFDKNIVIDTGDVSASLVNEGRLLVGFPESQDGSYIAKFKYIKYADCEYKYLNFSDIDFEFELDSSPLFDSINKRVYHKKDFDNMPDPVFDVEEDPETGETKYNAVYNAWAPLSYVCGSYSTELDRYDGLGHVTSIGLALPQRQDMAYPLFFYRVRSVIQINNEYVPISEFSNTYIEKRKKNAVFQKFNPVYYEYESLDYPLTQYVFVYDNIRGYLDENVLEYTEKDEGDHFIAATNEKAVVLLPNLPVHDDWKITFYNVGNYSITIKDSSGGYVGTVGIGQAVTCSYDTAYAYNWVTSTKHDTASFYLQADISSEIFKAVYNARIPAYDYVYSKALSSGNIANIVRAESKEADSFFAELNTASGFCNAYSADNDVFLERYGNIFGFDNPALFKNSADRRNIFQVMLFNLYNQTKGAGLKDVIYAITGTYPEITEYKDVLFNVVWSNDDMPKVSTSQKFYLYDDKNPSYITSPFVVYNQKDRYATMQIDIYDPYNLSYSRELVQQAIRLFKPGWVRTLVVFHDSEGMPIEEKSTYWYSKYINAAYNK